MGGEEREKKKEEKKEKEGARKKAKWAATRLDCETGFAVSNTLIY